jgi:hypothetical protein
MKVMASFASGMESGMGQVFKTDKQKKMASMLKNQPFLKFDQKEYRDKQWHLSLLSPESTFLILKCFTTKILNLLFQNKKMKKLKLLVVGDGGVGKSSLLISYRTDAFPSENVPTVIENDSVIIIADKTPYNIALWDTGGQVRSL